MPSQVDRGDLAEARKLANTAYEAYLDEIRTHAANEANPIESARTLLHELGSPLTGEAERQTAAGREIVKRLKSKLMTDTQDVARLFPST